MNWGHKITIVIIVFIVGMLGMVFIASMQTNEMIDKDYYKKELAYQQVIDASQNLINRSSNNLITQTMMEVVITLPVGTYEKLDDGNIEFLRNDSEKKDFSIELKRVGTNRHVIQKAELSKGVYRVRMKWSNNGIPYYKEESVFVEK